MDGLWACPFLYIFGQYIKRKIVICEIYAGLICRNIINGIAIPTIMITTKNNPR